MCFSVRRYTFIPLYLFQYYFNIHNDVTDGDNDDNDVDDVNIHIDNDDGHINDWWSMTIVVNPSLIMVKTPQ